jgi:hypothetical protein
MIGKINIAVPAAIQLIIGEILSYCAFPTLGRYKGMDAINMPPFMDMKTIRQTNIPHSLEEFC